MPSSSGQEELAGLLCGPVLASQSAGRLVGQRAFQVVAGGAPQDKVGPAYHRSVIVCCYAVINHRSTGRRTPPQN